MATYWYPSPAKGSTAVYASVYRVAIVCPENSQPAGETACTCNDPYFPDAAKKSCVTETYTIALVGLGGEVVPNATRAAYAEVKTSAGVAKAGAQVSLTLSVVPDDDGQVANAHEGTLLPSAGNTGGDGKFNFIFAAPIAGGTHTIKASCTNCTNEATGTIKVLACPEEELTPLADLSDSVPETSEQKQLTQQLESGMNGYSLLSKDTRTAEQCLASRISTVVGDSSGYKVTSTVRTVAYQKHLREVWDKFWDLKGKVANDPTLQQRCQTLISKVEGEIGFRLTQNPSKKKDKCTASGRRHCIRFQPAGANPKHTQGIAFDISQAAVDEFDEAVLGLTPPSTVEKESSDCGLQWGGSYGDRVHFLLQ